jgi:hypothetical protein
MSELQTLESIIESTPKGASHYGYCYFLGFQYWNVGMHASSFWDEDLWNYDHDIGVLSSVCSLCDIQKQIDQLKEIESLRQQLDAWAEKYADLKIESDANHWAHDNMQEQLASAKADGEWVEIESESGE